MEYSYKTKDVCSSEIRFRLDGDVVHDVRFTGGCNGNLKAIGILVEGLHVDEIEQKLRGTPAVRATAPVPTSLPAPCAKPISARRRSSKPLPLQGTQPKKGRIECTWISLIH